MIIHEIKEYLDRVAIHVSLAKKEQVCPSCGVKTIKVHDCRIQKVKRLKWFERLTILFYKRRRYVCVLESDFRKPTICRSLPAVFGGMELSCQDTFCKSV